MRTPQQIRFGGWFQIGGGLVMLTVVGILIYNAAPHLLHAGEPAADGFRSAVTAEQGRAATGLLAALITAGLLGIVNGVWSVKTRRVNLLLRVALLVAVAAMLYYLWLTRQAFGV